MRRPRRIHRVQVSRGLLFALPAGEEDHARHGRRDRASETADGRRRHLRDASLAGAVLARQHHVRFEEHPLERHPLSVKRVEHGMERGLGRLEAALDGVVPVHQDLGLDDRDHAGVLAQGGVAGERVGIGLDRPVGRKARADREHGAPLGEAGPQRRVLGEPLAQPVEAFRHLLVRGARERLRTPVDLDARNDPLAREDLDQGRPVIRPLANRLVEEDDAAHVVRRPRRGEEHLAIAAAGLLGVRDAQRLEAAPDAGVTLVGGEDALARGDEGTGRGLQPVHVHSWSSSVQHARRRDHRPARAGTSTHGRPGRLAAVATDAPVVKRRTAAVDAGPAPAPAQQPRQTRRPQPRERQPPRRILPAP